MWNDIDLYHAVRDFTADPVSFPPDEVRALIRELVSGSGGNSFPRPALIVSADGKPPALCADSGRSHPQTDQLHRCSTYKYTSYTVHAFELRALSQYDPYTRGVELYETS